MAALGKSLHHMESKWRWQQQPGLNGNKSLDMDMRLELSPAFDVSI